MAPATGEVAPSNTTVALLTYFGPQYADGLRLVDPSGASVPVTIDTDPPWGVFGIIGSTLLTPTGPLGPGGTYSIRDSADTELVSFRAAASPDTAPPAPALAQIVVDPPQPCADVFYCGYHPAGSIQVVHLDITNSQPDLTYELRESDLVIGRFLPATSRGAVVCPSEPLTDNIDPSQAPVWTVAPGAHRLDLYAVDRAGNRSSGTSMTFEADCTAAEAACSCRSGGRGTPPSTLGGLLVLAIFGQLAACSARRRIRGVRKPANGPATSL